MRKSILLGVIGICFAVGFTGGWFARTLIQTKNSAAQSTSRTPAKNSTIFEPTKDTYDTYIEDSYIAYATLTGEIGEYEILDASNGSRGHLEFKHKSRLLTDPGVFYFSKSETLKYIDLSEEGDRGGKQSGKWIPAATTPAFVQKILNLESVTSVELIPPRIRVSFEGTPDHKDLTEKTVKILDTDSSAFGKKNL